MNTVEEVSRFRAARRQAENDLVTQVAQLERARRRLAGLERLGETGRDEAARVRAEVDERTGIVTGARVALADVERDMHQSLLDLDLARDPLKGLARIDARTPIALLPVRVETAFEPADDERGPALAVRVYPDDVAVQSHEPALTDDEIELGRQFWIAVHRLRIDPDLDDEARTAREQGAWRTVAGEHGAPRAAWIVEQLRPTTLDVDSPEDLDFGTPETAPQTWSRAPRSTVMPDRFAVIAYQAGEPVLQQVGHQIADPLFLGPEPLAEEDELDSVDGDLSVSPGLEWIFDLEQAIGVGMAVRLPLSAAQAAEGFDRIVVVGLKLSVNPDDGAELVADLLQDHRYGPDGLSVVAQGTPTNNAESGGSGFSSVDTDTDRRYQLEFGPVPYGPTDERDVRHDGQVVTDALGLDPAVLQRVEGAAASDQREAMAANDALWPATLGYYMRDLLEVDRVTERSLARFFREHVTGRGPVPALRVAAQPYGLLVTSDFSRWGSPGFSGPSDDPMAAPVARLATRARTMWEEELDRVTRLGGPGDPHAVLLDVLGRHAGSVEQHRRRAAGPDYRSNWAEFTAQGFGDRLIRALIAVAATRLVEDLGADVIDDPPLLFELAFFNRAELLTDPVVERPEGMDVERWSELEGLQRIYHVEGHEEPLNYIGWLLRAPVADIKSQRFFDAAGERLPMPDALLYRWLRRAFLLASHDTTVRLLDRIVADPSGPAAAIGSDLGREHELVDIAAQPTATRWRLMELSSTMVDPDAAEGTTILEHLQTERGLSLADASGLAAVRTALSVLEGLPTARLERLFREHMDVCSYRLDAWIGALMSSRLDEMRSFHTDPGRRPGGGLVLGAYGWLEDVRPRPPAEPVPFEDVPAPFRPDDGSQIERRVDNGGHVHAPSLNHAATAAVLRNAYLATADRDAPERMAVDLSSARVRTALSLLEGTGEGQSLGALLGYRFERALTEHSSVPGLAQFLPAFRDAFALVADVVTPDPDGAATETKQVRHVVDGYALVEAAVLARPPLSYPWGVAGLPGVDEPAARALRDEVEALAGVLDSVADLLLAEAVFQSVRGNQERAGAVLQSLGTGATVQIPEMVRTPRSGLVIHHRVSVELPATTTSWPGPVTPRAVVQPELNSWLVERLVPPDRIRFLVDHRGPAGSDTDPTITIADLGLQPIDLLLGMGDDVHLATADEPGGRDDTTELERRIAHEIRRRLATGGQPTPESVTIRFLDRDPTWDADDVTVAELLPLLVAARRVITGSRPLSAVDLRPAPEADADGSSEPNLGGVDLTELTTRIDGAAASLTTARNSLDTAAQGLADDPNATMADTVRDALRAVANHGIGAAFPHSAALAEPADVAALIAQAASVLETVDTLLAQAADRRATVGADPDAIAADVSALIEVGRLMLGSDMPILPRFRPANGDELAVADDAAPAIGLDVETWWLGLTPVRAALADFDRLRLLGEAFGRAPLDLAIRQLPVRDGQPWVAGPVGTGDLADGHHLHLTHSRPQATDPRDVTVGLVLDEWTEVIPGVSETTGLAVHLHQPDSEPPQAILLAVPPRPQDTWSWDDLLGVIDDTLNRAKLRAVEPDHLATTALAHLLPAALTSVATTPLATISMALVAGQEAAIADREVPS